MRRTEWKFKKLMFSIYYSIFKNLHFIFFRTYISGFKKKKTAHSSGKEETEKRGTVFDFLNKIPSSSSSVDLRKKTGTGTKSAVLPRKEIKKITAKSAF